MIPEIKSHEEIFSVMHKQFCTDHYEYGHTHVKATSKQEAFDKLNYYLSTQPDGGYTDMLCEDVKYVFNLTYIE